MIKIIKSTEFSPDIIKRHVAADSDIKETVAKIINDVIANGDDALHRYTSEFDKCDLTDFELNRLATDKAIDSVDDEFIKIMQRAAANIEDYHSNQVFTGFDLLPKNGVILGQKVTPLERVACYIPGGSAPYPSSVLMNCIPAKIAGVKEIIVVTPPSSGIRTAGSGGRGHVARGCNGVDARIIAAAKIAGADRIFTIGGAQAIAALAYGTQSIPRTDKITGPGNAYVTEAKRQVYGAVGIDMLAGPSDVLIIADKHTKPELAAADMLSQCEHGSDSGAILVTDSMQLAKKVKAAIKAQLPALPRREMASQAIDSNSLIIVASTLEEVFDISNQIAPEHLEILLDDPFNYLSKVTNAGSIFLGEYTPETLGDYLAGPNHVLPTSGTARFSGPLTVRDFVKVSSYTYFTKEALIEKAPDAIRFAHEERLDGHAASVEKRLQDIETESRD